MVTFTGVSVDTMRHHGDIHWCVMEILSSVIRLWLFDLCFTKAPLTVNEFSLRALYLSDMAPGLNERDIL